MTTEIQPRGGCCACAYEEAARSALPTWELAKQGPSCAFAFVMGIATAIFEAAQGRRRRSEWSSCAQGGPRAHAGIVVTVTENHCMTCGAEIRLLRVYCDPECELYVTRATLDAVRAELAVAEGNENGLLNDAIRWHSAYDAERRKREEAEALVENLRTRLILSARTRKHCNDGTVCAAADGHGCDCACKLCLIQDPRDEQIRVLREALANAVQAGTVKP
jgi:hypothetical protein